MPAVPEMYISESMLLYKYNPYFYQKQFDEIEKEIQEMYHMSVATVSESDIGELIIIGYSVEDIAIEITERRERLERLKRSAARHCTHLYKSLNNVPPKYRWLLNEAQQSMNLRLLYQYQIRDVCNALWEIVKADESNVPKVENEALRGV